MPGVLLFILFFCHFLPLLMGTIYMYIPVKPSKKKYVRLLVLSRRSGSSIHGAHFLCPHIFFSHSLLLLLISHFIRIFFFTLLLLIFLSIFFLFSFILSMCWTESALRLVSLTDCFVVGVRRVRFALVLSCFFCLSISSA